MKKIFLLNLLIAPIHFCFSGNALNIQSEWSITLHNEGTIRSLSSSQEDGIIGSWNLLLQVFDDNSNGKLDDEERKKGNAGKYFYQFNGDGTCLIHTMKLKGYYELKNEGGKKRLYIDFDDKGSRSRENAWYVISVSKTELVLLSQDKFTFWIYKRV